MLEILLVDEVVPPGGELLAEVHWELPEAPERIDVAVFWETSGKGTVDRAIVVRETVTPAVSQGQESLRFRLPGGPYSFAGSIVSLDWGVEVVVRPSGAHVSERFELVPEGIAITLTPVPDERKPKKGCISWNR